MLGMLGSMERVTFASPHQRMSISKTISDSVMSLTSTPEETSTEIGKRNHLRFEKGRLQISNEQSECL